jgi:hypothetical protein
MDGRRLILKNPANTGRIPLLLAMFPDAKFIHIYRNPYTVFLSARHFQEQVTAMCAFQRITRAEIEANALSFYRSMMQKFLADRRLIPEGNLVEIRFEDLEADPLAELHQVYTSLRLPGFAAAEGAFRRYLLSQSGYQKNTFDVTDEVVALVQRHWHFAFEEWGYAADGRVP